MTQTDLTAFLGSYPFRTSGPSGPASLLAEMDRIGTSDAWISHLGAIYRRDPDGNAALYAAQAASSRLQPVPSVDAGQPDWAATLDEAVDRGAPAVRSDPSLHREPASGPAMCRLLAACAERHLPLMMAVRLEDVRQRQPEDPAADMQPWMIRQLVRSDPAARLIVTHADREFIEQVHFGSTPAEAQRILWDITWIWGPPEDHLELLLETVGLERFAFGTGMPLRLPETSVAKLDLLEIEPIRRRQIAARNVEHFSNW